MKHIEEDGLSFDYPDDWTLEREREPDGWTVTVQSPGAAFAVVRLDRSMPPTEEVAAAALATLREDYPALEATPMIEAVGGEMAIGHDIDFFSLDLATTCWTRTFYGVAGTVLVLCQATDAEPEEHQWALRALCASMQSEG